MRGEGRESTSGQDRGSIGPRAEEVSTGYSPLFVFAFGATVVAGVI